MSIVERLGGFSWCEGTAFSLTDQTFLKKKNKSSLRNIFWDNESYAIKQYLKMFSELASATLKQVADWFVWLASTLGKFFDKRSGRSTSRKGGACYRRDARKPSAMPTNVFDKPNEQNEALFNYAMARKRRMKSNSDVPTMKSTTLLMADTMDEYKSSSKGYRDRQLLYDNSLINWNLL